jgi:hypothetical protein
MSYQMSVLLIHRPYVRESPDSSSFSLALATMNMATSRMTHHIHLFNKQYLQKSPLDHSNSAPPFTIHHILTAAIMHLIAGTTSERSPKIVCRRKLQICMQVLSALQNMWASAGKAIAQIRSLTVQCRWSAFCHWRGVILEAYQEMKRALNQILRREATHLEVLKSTVRGKPQRMVKNRGYFPAQLELIVTTNI